MQAGPFQSRKRLRTTLPMMTRYPFELHGITFALLVAFLWVSPASAQTDDAADEPATQASDSDLVEPSTGQQTLNDEGVKAMIDEDYERAVKLLQESLALGDLNITYLNLGRAYQKQGKCLEAQDAYLSAISAPAVNDPPQRLIDAKADKYLGELRQECGDKLDVEPRWGDAPAVKWGMIGGGVAVAAFGGFAMLRAGQVAPDAESFERDAAGVIVSPTQQAAFDDRQRARTWGTVGVSALTVGAAAIGVGTYFLVTENPAESQPSAVVGPDGSWRVGWSVRF